ncbi:ubiquitin carboxyl-terminal hydrolase 30-like protein [Elysia marginata]|uniref:ubiquitinyl hydrolase 1 n=1 Tax=Elysia marginata TaxID=1093978 RepID=A0AAV4J7F9_9GAST|nr:ubiquitin carboxyl-terminal hydrolase 30-like protein [Elysia marginata]
MLSRVTAGIAGAVFAALTGAYVIWGPTKKRPKDQCPGLVNVGNSCFLNSLLQAWAACPSLYGWLHCMMDSMSRNNEDRLLTSTIFKVIKVLNNEDSETPDPYDPSQVFQALRAKRWVITSDEQDAHELMNVLTETLDEEASRYPSCLSLFDVKHLQGPLSVDLLLQQFIRQEVVQDVECSSCAKLAGRNCVKSNFRKKVSLGKLPQVLCVHLPRTQWMSNGAVVKRFDHVHFPDSLVMDRYMYTHAGAGDSNKDGLMGGADLAMQMIRWVPGHRGHFYAN